MFNSCSKFHEKQKPPSLKVKNWAYQLQNADPEEIKKIKDSGKIPVAYISIGEAENYRFYWTDEWYNNPPEWLGKENP